MAGSAPRPYTVASPSGIPIVCRDLAEVERVRAWVQWVLRDAEARRTRRPVGPRRVPDGEAP